jgi:hypothetical protein
MQHDIYKHTILVPYILAEQVSEDKKVQDALILKAEEYYRNSRPFRDSFKRNDVRAVLKMWFYHWLPQINNPKNKQVCNK